MTDHLSGDAETVVNDYEMQLNREPRASAEVTVFPVPHRTADDERVWFGMNLAIDEEVTYAYAEAFRQRWGIETSYPQIGDFLPRTSSPTFSVQLFYFLFAVTLYSLWVLPNLLVSDGKISGKQPISTRIFLLFFAPRAYG